MKTTTAIILFSLLFFVTSCKKRSFTVQGRWRPVAVDTNYVKSFGLNDQQVKDMLDHTLIGFQKGGTFFSFETKDTVRGLYTYDEPNQQLSTIPGGLASQTFKVDFLQQNEMTLTNAFGKMTLKRQ
jgi:hypothetical protein